MRTKDLDKTVNWSMRLDKASARETLTNHLEKETEHLHKEAAQGNLTTLCDKLDMILPKMLNALYKNAQQNI